MIILTKGPTKSVKHTFLWNIYLQLYVLAHSKSSCNNFYKGKMYN